MSYTKGEIRAMRKMARFYGVEIRYSDEDEGYIATVSALPGCSAFGLTRIEAAEEIEDAIEAWIGAAANLGRRAAR